MTYHHDCRVDSIGYAFATIRAASLHDTVVVDIILLRYTDKEQCAAHPWHQYENQHGHL